MSAGGPAPRPPRTRPLTSGNAEYQPDRRALLQLRELYELVEAQRQGWVALAAATQRLDSAKEAGDQTRFADAMMTVNQLAEPISGLLEAVGDRAAVLARQARELAERHAHGNDVARGRLVSGYQRLATALDEVVARWAERQDRLAEASAAMSHASLRIVSATAAQTNGGVLESAGERITEAEAAERAEVERQRVVAALVRIDQSREPFDTAGAAVLREIEFLAETHAKFPLLAAPGESVDPHADRRRFLLADPEPGERPGMAEVSHRDLELAGNALDLADEWLALVEQLANAGHHGRRAADFQALRGNPDVEELHQVEERLRLLVIELGLSEALDGSDARFKWLETMVLHHRRPRNLDGLRLLAEFRPAAEQPAPGLAHALMSASALNTEKYGDRSVTGVYGDKIHRVITGQTREFPVRAWTFPVGGYWFPDELAAEEPSFHNVVEIDWLSGDGRIFRPGFTIHFVVAEDGPALRRADWVQGGWVEATQLVLQVRRDASRAEVDSGLREILDAEIATFLLKFAPMGVHTRAASLGEVGGASGVALGTAVSAAALGVNPAYLAGRGAYHLWSSLVSPYVNYVSEGKALKAHNTWVREWCSRLGGIGPTVRTLTEGAHDTARFLAGLADIFHVELPDAPAFEPLAELTDTELAEFTARIARLGPALAERLDGKIFPRRYIANDGLADTFAAIRRADWQEGRLIIELGSGETLTVQLVPGTQSHSYQVLKDGDADRSELRYHIGLSPNLHSGGEAALLDALSAQIVDVVVKGSTLWIQPSMASYATGSFAMWPLDAAVITGFGLVTGTPELIAPMMAESLGRRASGMAAAYLNVKHRQLATALGLDALREREQFARLFGANARLEMADRSLRLLDASVRIGAGLDGEIAGHRAMGEPAPADPVEMTQLAAAHLRDRAAAHPDVRAAEIVESVLVISMRQALEIRIAVGAAGELPTALAPMTAHGLVSHREITSLRDLTMLLPSQWAGRIPVDELTDWLDAHLDDILTREPFLRPRAASQLAGHAGVKAAGAGVLGAAVSLAQGNVAGAGQEVGKLAKEAGDGAMGIVTEGATTEQVSQRALTQSSSRAATASAMDDVVRVGVRGLARRDAKLRALFAEHEDPSVRALADQLGDLPAPPDQLIDEWERMRVDGELVERVPHLARVARLGRGEYVLYIDTVAKPGPLELRAKLAGAHQQHVILRLLPGVPGEPTMLLPSVGDAYVLGIGTDAEALLAQLRGMVAHQHHGPRGVPSWPEYLMGELGGGNVGGLISRGVTDPSLTNLLAQGAAAAVSSAFNATAGTWFGQGESLQDSRFIHLYNYNGLMMLESRNQLAQYYAGKLAEHTRRQTLLYLEFAEITSRYSPTTVEILRGIFGEEVAVPQAQVLAEFGLDTRQLPKEWTFDELNQLVDVGHRGVYADLSGLGSNPVAKIAHRDQRSSVDDTVPAHRLDPAASRADTLRPAPATVVGVNAKAVGEDRSVMLGLTELLELAEQAQAGTAAEALGHRAAELALRVGRLAQREVRRGSDGNEAFELRTWLADDYQWLANALDEVLASWEVRDEQRARFERAVAALLAGAAALQEGQSRFHVFTDPLDPRVDRPRVFRANPKPGKWPGLAGFAERDLDAVKRLFSLLDADSRGDADNREQVRRQLRALVGELGLNESQEGSDARFEWLRNLRWSNRALHNGEMTLGMVQLLDDLRKPGEHPEPGPANAFFLLRTKNFGDSSVTGAYHDKIYSVLTRQTTEFPIRALTLGVAETTLPDADAVAEPSFHNVVHINWWSGSAKAKGGRVLRPGFTVQIVGTDDADAPAVRRAEWLAGKRVKGGWVHGSQLVLEVRNDAGLDEVDAALGEILLAEIAGYQPQLSPMQVQARLDLYGEGGGIAGVAIGEVISAMASLGINPVHLAGRLSYSAWSSLVSPYAQYMSSAKAVDAYNEWLRMWAVVAGGIGPTVRSLTEGAHETGKLLSLPAEVFRVTMPDTPPYDPPAELDDTQVAEFAERAGVLGRAYAEQLVGKELPWKFPWHYPSGDELPATFAAISDAVWVPGDPARPGDFGALRIELGSGEKLTVSLVLGGQSHSYQMLTGGDADAGELSYRIGLSPNLYYGDDDALLDALAVQIVDVVAKGSTLWLQPGMGTYLKQSFALWPIDAGLVVAFALLAGTPEMIAPMLAESVGRRAGSLAAEYRNFKHQHLAMALAMDAVREHQGFDRVFGAGDRNAKADQALGLLSGAWSIHNGLNEEIRRFFDAGDERGRLVPADPAELIAAAARRLRYQAVVHPDVRDAVIRREESGPVLVIYAKPRARQPRLPGELRIALGVDWAQQPPFVPMTAHGLVHRQGMTDIRDLTMLLPGQWAAHETRITVAELNRWLDDHLDDLLAREATLSPREISQLSMASGVNAATSGAIGAGASLSHGNVAGASQEVVGFAKATGEGGLRIITERAITEQAARREKFQSGPRAATARRMDDLVQHTLHAQADTETSLRELDGEFSADDPPHHELLGWRAELGEPSPPNHLLDDFERMRVSGELVDRIPHLAKVERLGRGEYVLYVDMVAGSGRGELKAKARGAHRQEILVRLLPGVPGEPTRLLANSGDSRVLGFGDDIEILIGELRTLVVWQHNGATGVPALATVLLEEAGGGSVGGLVSRGTTEVAGGDPHPVNLATQAAASAVSSLVNMNARTWFRQGENQQDGRFIFRYNYDGAMMGEVRNALAQYYARRITETTRRQTLAYLRYAEITGRYSVRTITILRALFAPDNVSRSLSDVLAGFGFDIDELPARWNFSDLDALVSAV